MDMQIPPSSIPLLPQPAAQSSRRDRIEQVESQQPDIRNSQRDRNPAEYVFQAEVEDDGFNADSFRQVFGRSVDPVNRGAILSYATTSVTSFGQPERVGRHLDLFL